MATMPDIEWMCLACMYVTPRPGADPNELDVLTIANGQMVCLRHVGCAASDRHNTIMAAVWMESNGEIDSLSAYQDWRGKQPEPEEATDG
jgi:acyl-CoA thioesterase